MTNHKVCDTRLSQKLEVLQRIQSHLLTVIGHEFWTPLSTSQVCLESLAQEPLIPSEYRQIILETAFKDIERLSHLIQTTLSISELELKPIDRYYQCEKLSDGGARWKIMALADILDRNQPRILQQHECNECKLFPNREQNTELFSNSTGDTSTHLRDSHSSNKLEILEHTRKNLIAIVGHELRTPLCTIQVCLESLVKEPAMPSEYRQAMLEIALGDIERLRQLIQDFFILLRLENGQLYHRPGFVEFQEVVDIALSSLRGKTRECSLPRITVDIPSLLPKIQVDGDRVVEALIKLIDNAYKFTDIDGIINIQVQIYQASTIMLEVIVADNGLGIAPDNLEAVFKHFYQEEDSLRRSVGGTGIGLAICRYIIHSMGGEIWASSEGKHKGTQIHFTIPVVEATT